MKRAETVRLFKTMPHACGYYAGTAFEDVVGTAGVDQIGEQNACCGRQVKM